MRLALIALLAGGIACNAAVQYQFNYTALNGPVKSFSFSVTAPGYLAAGAAPTLAPFTATDGTNSWSFTQGLAGLANPYLGCFLFGTASTGLGAASAGLIGGPCAVGISDTGFQAGFAVYTESGLPTAPGTYPELSFGGGFGPPDATGTFRNFSNATGSMTLIISDTSVPAAAACSAGMTCNVLYEFTYNAINGPVKSFAFSFTAPTYLQAGETPIITDFTPTDGDNSWTATKGIVTVVNTGTQFQEGCFMFGTPFAVLTPVLSFGVCAVGVGGPGFQAGFYVLTSGGLPTAPGTYTGLRFAGSFGASTGMESIGTITNAVDNTGTMTLTVSETPAPLLSGAIAHLAVAGNWQTNFTLVNKDTSTSQVNLNLFGEDGSLLSSNSSVPQPLVSDSGTTVGATSATTAGVPVASNASLIVDNSGISGQPLQVGSAQLLAKGNVGGFAIFKDTVSGQEAAVPLETRDAPSYKLAFDNTNGLALGVALQNVSASPANIPVILRDDKGTQIGSDTITLAGLSHTSFVLAAQYPVAANSKGTIEFDTPAGGRIGALGLRFTPAGTLTAVPVLANVSNVGGSVAHIAAGGGWKTTVVLVNTGASAAGAHLAFFDDNGSPLLLPLSFPQTGDQSPASLVDRTIAANASLVVESVGADSVATGSVQLTTDGQVSGYAILEYLASGQEAVAPFGSSGANAYVIPFDHTGGIATGTAVNNVSALAIHVPVILRDDAGNQIGAGSLALPANGHKAFVLADEFPVTANIRGTIEFATPVGAEINVLGIRTTPALTFTTLPTVTR